MIMRCLERHIKILIFLLCVSLVIIIVLSAKITNKDNFSIKGTFQLGSGHAATYILFDDRGHFCRYTQEEGVLSEGNYQQLENGCYQLVFENEITGCVLHIDDRVYFFDGESKEINIYTRLSSALVLYDTATDEWPKWCTVSEETNG